MNWIPLAVIVAFVIAYAWWGSGAIIRNRKLSNQSIELYSAHIDLAKEANLLRLEELAAIRELIAELRAARQAPGQAPTSSADSH